MLTIVPFLPGMLHKDTRVWAHNNDALLVELAPDLQAYWRLLAHVYTVPVTTLNVEQDMVPPPGIVEELDACPEPWCVCPYYVSFVTPDGLGCTKWDRKLRLQYPDLLQEAGDFVEDAFPVKAWYRLDYRIATLLRRRGYEPHRHADAEHRHDYTETLRSIENAKNGIFVEDPFDSYVEPGDVIADSLSFGDVPS